MPNRSKTRENSISVSTLYHNNYPIHLKLLVSQLKGLSAQSPYKKDKVDILDYTSDKKMELGYMQI